jgi:small ubiquitin-related modifier
MDESETNTATPITIKVRDQAGDVMLFKVKKTTEMKRIFEAYAQRLGLAPKNLKFMLDGERIKESDTPKMLELQDEDQIDVLLEQVGGGDSADGKPTGDDAVITVRVKDAQGNEVGFKVKKITKMSKIYEAYASRKGVQTDSVRFIFDGQRVNKDDTPKTLELQEDDVIEAAVEQTGGFL